MSAYRLYSIIARLKMAIKMLLIVLAKRKDWYIIKFPKIVSDRKK